MDQPKRKKLPKVKDTDSSSAFNGEVVEDPTQSPERSRLTMDYEFEEQDIIDEPLDCDMGNDIDIDEVVEEKLEETTVLTGHVDLDSFSKYYTGYAYMRRLLFISDVCPSLRFDALKLLLDYVTSHTQNVSMYKLVYQKIEQFRLAGDNSLSDKIPPIDNKWIEQTNSKSTLQLDTLITEYRRQKEEAVKESVRRSMEEVFHQYILMGQINEAIKLYGRGMRENCTAPNYVLSMLINWMNVSIYAENWGKLLMLLPQADRAMNDVMERESVANNPNNRSGSSSTTTTQFSGPAPTSKNYKELVQSAKAKLASLNGLSKLQQREYKAAAEYFLKVDIDALDYPQMVSAGDVAAYGTLCALATFTRAELKEHVLGSTLFRKFLESEPKLVELLQKFCRSEFGICLDILNELRDQLLLNMYLAPHIHQLYNRIRQCSIVQYFHPYVSASINNMAVEFRTDYDGLKNELVNLIEKKLLDARIDSNNKVLVANFSNNRKEIYERVNKLRTHLNERVYAILLRSALQTHRIVIGAGGGGNGGDKSPLPKGRRRGNNYLMDIDVADSNVMEY